MEPPKKRLGSGRVAFLARKEEIKAKIDAGYTMIAVYEEHQKQLGISYGQFVNYVNKFIKEKPDENKPASPEKEIEPTPKKPEHGLPKFKRTENREDLIKPKS